MYSEIELKEDGHFQQESGTRVKDDGECEKKCVKCEK